MVAEAVVEYLKPIQENIARYMSSKEHLVNILKHGNEKARDIASKNWDDVQYKLGLKSSIHSNEKIQINKA